MALSPGARLGSYEILELIGAGGMGEVYRARDPGLAREVAIKVLPPAAGGDSERLKRFEREARAIGALNHPNILTVHATGVHDGIPYVVSELLEGDTLHARLRTDRLTPRKALDVAVQIARGLAAAHAKGIVHRDLKPANVFLPKHGPVKILDFGLAKLIRDVPDATATVDLGAPATRPGTVMGTAGYMSPEQVRGQPVDHRSDIFSFGVVLYEMLAGRRAFQGDTVADTMLAILKEDPPDVPALNELPALSRIVRRCVEKRAEDRFHSTDDLAFALEALSGSGSVTATPAATAGKPARRSAASRGTAIALVSLLAAGLIAFAVWRGRQPAPTVTGAAVRSIAVLPFKPLVAGKGDAALELGMADALITKLGNIRQIAVRPTTSIVGYGAEGQDLRKAAEALNVEMLVDGRIQQVGDRLRLSVQVIRAADGFPVWSNTFDEPLRDIFALQDSISERVASALSVSLTGEERRGLSKRYTENIEAYQLYLQGHHHWSTFRQSELMTAINYYNEALKKDPSYALAYSGLANAYSVIGIYGPLPANEAMPKSAEAAREAIRLDAELAPAHSALGGFKLLHEWDWPGAERELLRAQALDPNLVDAHALHGYYLQAMGRPDEAVAELQRASDLAPDWQIALNDVPWSRFLARRYDETIAIVTKAIALQPENGTNYSLLGQALVEKGQRAEAIAAHERAVALMTPSGRATRALGELGYAYAVAGRTTDALQVIDRVKAQSSPWNAFALAEIYTGLGDRASAFACLDTAFDDRFAFLWRLRVMPQFDALRADPRYGALLRRMNLTP